MKGTGALDSPSERSMKKGSNGVTADSNHVSRYAPINIMPHYPPPAQCWGIGGDLNFAKFKCTTYWACQSVKSQPSPHSTIEEKRNLTVGAFNCSTCIWRAVKFPTYGASFSVKTGQMPHLFPYIAQEGGSGGIILIGALSPR